jgi:hypothetical protein
VLATAKFFAAERTVLADDQIDLAGMVRLDRVELPALLERGTGALCVDVEACGAEIVYEEGRPDRARRVPAPSAR